MSNHNWPFITTGFLLGSSGSLDFCLASLKSLGCFYFRCILSSQWKAVTVNLPECVWQQAISCCWCYRMPPNTFFSMNSQSSGQPKKWCKDTFFHPPSPFLGNFCNCNSSGICTALNSRFNFHCYTQHEATPTRKSAWKWQLQPLMTSCAKDCKGHSLMQTSFTEPPNRAAGKTSCSLNRFGLSYLFCSFYFKVIICSFVKFWVHCAIF